MGLFSFLFKTNKQENKLKVGLALAGGGAKGIAHIGVIKAFEEEGIKFDMIAGTSAGSIVGAALAAGTKFDQMVELALDVESKDIRKNKVFFMPSKTSGIENLVIKSIGGNKNFDDLQTKFFCVATCLNDGKEQVFSSGNVAKSVCASCCFPGFFIPVEINGKNYVDGGLINNLPTSVLRDNLCDVVIAVDLAAPNKMGTESIKALEVLGTSYKIMSSINVKYARELADVVIKPDLTGFKATKLKDPKKLIEEGYIAAREQMPKIKYLLEHTKPLNVKKYLRQKEIENAKHKQQMKKEEEFNIYGE